MSKRDDYVAKMKQQSDELKAEIDTLETKAQEAKEDAKTKHQEQISKLRAKYQEGETKLEAIKAAAGAFPFCWFFVRARKLTAVGLRLLCRRGHGET